MEIAGYLIISEVTGDSFLSSSASSFISSLISTTAAVVFIPAIVAVLAVMVVVVEIRVETLFLLVLEEAGTLVFLISQFGSGCCHGITDVGIVAPALRSMIVS